MDAALSIEIRCDKLPAQHHVAPAIVAAIAPRLGKWTVTVHERHGGHCWDVRIHHADWPDQQFVFLGDDRTAERVQRTIEGALRSAAPDHPPAPGRTTAGEAGV